MSARRSSREGGDDDDDDDDNAAAGKKEAAEEGVAAAQPTIGWRLLRSGRVLGDGGWSPPPPPPHQRRRYVKVTVGRRSWYCGREALASASGYFRAMLGGADYRERLVHEVRIPEGGTPVTEAAFDKIARFVNGGGGELQVRDDDAVDLLVACSYLQIRHVGDRLFEAVGKTTSMKELVKLYSWPELANASATRETVRKFICSRFEGASVKCFSQLPFNTLRELLLYPDLTFRHRKLVDCVIAWIAYDPHQRLPFVARLMKIIYWGYEEPPALADLTAGLLNSRHKHDYLRFVVENALHQRPTQLALGTTLYLSQSGEQAVRLEYSVEVRPLARDIYNVDEAESVLLDENVFVAIGRPARIGLRPASSDDDGSTFYACDTEQFRWRELRPTNGRCHELVACDGAVYAYHEAAGRDAVSAYVPLYDRWWAAPKPAAPVRDCALVAGGRLLYAVAGDANQPLGAEYRVQMYDARCHSWQLVAACDQRGERVRRRFSKRALLLDQRLYVFHDELFEALDLRARRWTRPLATTCAIVRYPRRPRHVFSLPRLPVVVVDADYRLHTYDLNEQTWSTPVNPFWNCRGAFKPGFIPLYN